jgi:hypothetical protein
MQGLEAACVLASSSVTKRPARTTNEVRVMHILTKTLIAAMNVREA